MSVAYLFDPVKQFVSRNGVPLAGGFLNVFVGESQEPADTFSDPAGTVMNPKKIPIDTAGRALGVFVDDTKLYTLKAYNSGGMLQFSIYPVAPGKGGGGSGTSYYWPGDEYIYIDQDAREISLHNLKPIRGDGDTIIDYDSDGAVVFSVNPSLIGNETHVAAGEHTTVDFDSDNNTYTVNAKMQGTETVEVDSDGNISGKYRGGYGIEVSGNTISKKHHRLMATNNVQYTYCKVFDFTWQYVYGRGQCVFTATHYGGSYVTYAVSATRALGANFTVGWPYVVAASDDMVKSSAFIERLEIREVGSRLIGYLKLRNFSQNQFWLDWEGSSNAGILSFTPELTNSPEGEIAWTRTVDRYDVWYSQADADYTFQKKLTAGENIHIDSDNVISADGGDSNVFIAEYGTTTYAEVEEALGYGKIVSMRLEESPEEILGAQYGGYFVYPDVNEYYFFALGNGGQKKIYRLTSEDQWSTFTPDELSGKVFIAVYDSTLFRDVKTAIDQGKYVVVRRGTQYYVMIHDFDERTVFESKLSMGWNSANFCEVDSDDNWIMYSSTAPVTTFAEHGGVITTDAWNQVDQTTSFVLAQKGTHGGTMQVGAKIGSNGWTGSYKVFTRLYHNSNNQSAPANGTTEFSTVSLTASDFEYVGSVPQYLLQTGVQWTYIIELAYSNSPGRSVRFTISGIGSTDITFLAEEIR